MKLNLNSKTNHSLEHINKKNFISNNNNNLFTNTIGKMHYSRNNLSNEWKTFFNSNDNRNIKKYINLNDIKNNSIIKVNNRKDKNNIKRPAYSASFIKKIKFHNYNINIHNNHSSQNLIQKKYYNLKQIHEIISLIEKQLYLFYNIKKDNKGNYLSEDNKINDNLYSLNFINQRNNESQKAFHINKIIYKLNTHYFLKENINIEDNRIYSINRIKLKNNKLNKKDLTPFPYKRIQKKLRKYFWFSKNIKLSDEQCPFNYISKKIILKNKNKYNNHSRNNLKCNNLSINKAYKGQVQYHNDNDNDNDNDKNNNDIEKKKKIIKKEDKSVNTENIFIDINSKNKIKNLKKQKIKNNTFFNNQLISSMTNNKNNKFFITTFNNKNKYLENINQTHRAIYLYHKNY